MFKEDGKDLEFLSKMGLGVNNVFLGNWVEIMRDCSSRELKRPRGQSNIVHLIKMKNYICFSGSTVYGEVLSQLLLSLHVFYSS